MTKPINTIEKTFKYKVADELYSSETTLSKEALATYNGPDKVWIFVDNDTGKISNVSPPLTEGEDGDEVPTPVGTTKVEVNADQDITVLSILQEGNVTYHNNTELNETLPTNETISYPEYPSITDTYDVDNLIYDTASEQWTGFVFASSSITWDDIINIRNGALTSTDGKISPDMPDDIKQPWVEYRQKLRDLPSVYGYKTDEQVDAWKVRFPTSPEDLQ